MTTSIKTFIFDSYGTLFNLDVLQDVLNQYFPGDGKAISETWREKQMEYTFSREITGTYAPFSTITHDALTYAVEKHGYYLKDEQEVPLMRAYLYLPVFPDVKTVLPRISARKPCAILSNGSHDMLDPLIIHNNLPPYFSRIISADEIKRYKPTLRCYHYAAKQIHTAKEQVLYVSAHSWGIAGAKKYGFQTALINREQKPIDRLGQSPDVIYTSLLDLLDWV